LRFYQQFDPFYKLSLIIYQKSGIIFRNLGRNSFWLGKKIPDIVLNISYILLAIKVAQQLLKTNSYIIY